MKSIYSIKGETGRTLKAVLLLVFLGSAALCAAGAIAEDSGRGGNEKADMSYSFGMLMAEDLVDTGLEFNYYSFMQGFKDAMEKKETRLTTDEAVERVQTVFSRLEALDNEKRQREGEKSLAEGEAFLAENAKRSGIIVTDSGLQYETVTEGTGEIPGIGDTVLVHYRGTTIDGTVFDSTYAEGDPLEIPLDRVIPGWAEGLRLMKEGGKSVLYIPPNLAYGERGAGSSIGPNSVLVFEVEFLNIVKPDKEEEE